jgi:hypothetical protein
MLFTILAAIVISLIIIALHITISRERSKIVGKVTDITLVSERKGDNEMASLLTYKIGLPTSDSHDAASKKLRVSESRTGGDTKDTDVDVSLADTETLIEVEENAVVVLIVEIVDDAGNVATSEAVEFTATDTLPPNIVGTLEVLSLESERPAPE